MDLEEARQTIQNLTNKIVTNNQLADALKMYASGVSRKISTKTPLKLKQLMQLESYFNVSLINKNDKNGKKVHLDKTAIKKIIVTVEKFLLEENLSLHPEKKAELILTLYEMFLNGSLTSIEEDNIIPFCKLIA